MTRTSWERTLRETVLVLIQFADEQMDLIEIVVAQMTAVQFSEEKIHVDESLLPVL